MHLIPRFIVIFFLGGCFPIAFSLASEPPIMLMQDDMISDAQSPSGGRVSFALMRLPRGEFAFYDRNQPHTGPLTLRDRDGNSHSLSPGLPAAAMHDSYVKSGVLANTQVIWTNDQKAISVFVKAESIERAMVAEVGLPRYLNVWAQGASVSKVSEPRLVWRGYNGSLMEYQQLSSGRIVVPYGSFLPHAKATPPFGRHQIVVQLSDDEGQSWYESTSHLKAPCYDQFNGSNEGACEPSIEQMEDGRIWMLFRTQAGFLYESSSSDQGLTWQPATPSRFSTSTGPPNILRHKSGALILCWNNCEMPPRVDGEGVYGGRDALHIAISNDDGRTWRGFREIYLDHRRNDNPAKSGDRGTAYPLAGYTSSEQIVVLAGQGAGGRNPILIDPAWITENESSTDFSKGLTDWSVYKHFGPAKSWWRARAVGCDLVDHPSRENSQCLHLRKPDELPSDGATWNFPNGWSGSLRTRIWIREGCQGGTICLNDRMFDPCNDEGERFSIYRLDFSPALKLGDVVLTPNAWHDFQIRWNLSRPHAELFVDGRLAGRLELRHPSLNGISYIRFRSTASEIDSAGFLVEHVDVKIDDPYAPAVTAEELLLHERRYIENVVSRWKQRELPTSF